MRSLCPLLACTCRSDVRPKAADQSNAGARNLLHHSARINAGASTGYYPGAVPLGLPAQGNIFRWVSLTLDRKPKISGENMSPRAAKSVAAEEVAAIKDLMSDLEKRLHRLSGKARREISGTSEEVGDFVGDAFDRLTHRMREGAVGVSRSVADEAKRFGSNAFQKMADEIENRPLLMLAIAAGIGFLAGQTSRR